MANKIFHVRVGWSKGEDEHQIFTFYNVEAENKHTAGQIARSHAAKQFGGTPKDWEAEYIWDAGIMVDLKKDPIINPTL